MKSRLGKIIYLLIFLALTIPANGFSLDYPTREIEFIVAFAPGGGADACGRLIASFGEKHVGKPIIVINKVGGGGSRGFGALSIAKPDGYTIGIISNSIVSQPYLLKGVNYSTVGPKRNLRPICRIDYSTEGLCALKGGHYDVPLPELVRKAKENPGVIKLGVVGAWTNLDLVRAVFEAQAGIKFKVIPFPGSGEMIPALLGGHVDIGIMSSGERAPLYDGGKINVLAISSEMRHPRYPEIPTFLELGYDVVLPANHWLAAPVGTPDEIIQFLAEAFRKAFAEPAFTKAQGALGATTKWDSPEGAQKSLEHLDRVMQDIVKKYNLKPM